MADSAKTATQPSLRAKKKKSKGDGEKKVVFKSVLDNPFRIKWPSVPQNLQNLVLAQLISMLEGVAEYTSLRLEANKKRKRAIHQAKPSKRRKQDDGTVVEPVTATVPTEVNPINTETEAPSIYSHLVLGINEVTKRLETQAQSYRQRLTSAESVQPGSPSIKLVFACYADVDPPLLLDHLPHLVAAVNSAGPDASVLLIPLPKGSESTLAAALCIRRVAVLALDAETPNMSNMDPLLEPVPRLSAPWLSNLATDKLLIPAHIKQVRTTAPKDMKAAKEQRAKAKAAAKKKKKGVEAGKQGPAAVEVAA